MMQKKNSTITNTVLMAKLRIVLRVGQILLEPKALK